MNNEELSESISNDVQEKVLKEMNYLMREQEQLAEERFQRLDDALRKHVKSKEPKMSQKIKRMFAKAVEA